MSRSRSGSDNNGWLWAIGIGAALLFGTAVATQGGGGIEGGGGTNDIDKTIDWLNGRFGKQWVSFGINTLLAAAPPPFDVILPLVFQAEQEHLGRKGTGSAKKLRAQALRQRKPQPA